MLERTVADVMKDFPRSTYRIAFREQYRNMKVVLDKHPQIVAYAMEAIERARLKPVLASIRGGTKLAAALKDIAAKVGNAESGGSCS